MEIRTAVPEDMPALLELTHMLYDEAARLQPYNYRPADPQKEALLPFLTSPDRTILLAEHDGTPAGLAALAEQRTESLCYVTPHRYARLVDLIVRADLREIGIGSSLLDAAKDWARSRGLEHLELNTLPENRDAARLYERNGFESSLIRMQYRF